jgi:predicted dehydrogenase
VKSSAPSLETIGIGFVGYGWISRAHAHALHTLNHLEPPAKRIRLVSIAGRRREPLEAAARELGFERWTADWEELVDDPDVDVVANLTAVEGHPEPTIGALERGKPVLCEKPLATGTGDARAMLAAADDAGATNATGFNYRYVPAVALARELVEDGRLGRVRQYRALYLQDYQVAGGQPRSSGGAGAVLDYSHLVDMLRFLAGEPEAVSAQTASFVSDRDDAYAAIFELPDGATATLEASRVALGWKGRQRVEITGETGALWWDMEDPNRLHVFLREDEAEGLGGFRDVLVTQPEHPYVAQWWPPGHVLGWDASFVHQWRDFLNAVLEDRPVPTRQASFEDGYRAAVLCEAILTAAREGRRVAIDEPTNAAVHGGRETTTTKGRA